MRVYQLVYLLSAVSSLVSAAQLHHFNNEGDFVGMGCKNALVKKATFCNIKGKKASKSYECECRNAVAMGSFVGCGYTYTEDSKEATKQFEKFVLQQCEGNVTLEEIRNAYENVTKYWKTTDQIEGFNKSKPTNVPVKISKKVFKLYYDSYYARYKNIDDAMWMGTTLLSFWALVVFFGMVSNFAHMLIPTVWMSLNKALSRLYIVRKYRQLVSVPTAFNGAHTAPSLFGAYLPTRLESIVVFIFVTMSAVFLAANYHYVEDGVIWSGKASQFGRYIGDRSGILTNFLFTVTWLFAGRNNVLLFLTGWKQSTFLTYHKWVARVSVASLFIHTISMLVNTVAMGKYHTRKRTGWWRWGSVSIVAGIVILFQAMPYFRRHSYEIFLYFHILLAMFFLIGGWMHTDFFGSGQWWFACAAIWGFDRFLRFVRIAHFGLRTAKVKLISNETLEITVPRHNWWVAFPGSVAYVYFVGTPLFWQSHPFTMVSSNDCPYVKFLIKVKNGATKSIAKSLIDKTGQEAHFRIAVEGPYGSHTSLDKYDNVLLYSGGNGIPGPFTYARELGELSLKDKAKKVPFVKFYWVIRYTSQFEWFMDELKSLEKYNNIQMIIYVTKPQEGEIYNEKTSDADSSSSADDNKEAAKLYQSPTASASKENKSEEHVSVKLVRPSAFPNVEFRRGRPCIPELLNSDLNEVAGSNVAVMSCAHSSMVDAVRDSLAKEVGSRSGGRIEYIEELQIW
ncbi:uncharacterized protein Ecym_7183 [Eremothecium cymbalariae DBVPG|uniref:FAD-binding FR-type domain-containing protein n=1 Tax=Eremothecium cymbalariae (strain CBS 270.75 / DBVPG 7215 / KCTC 17166 / NRRL Y-17582) TaxID=931890 RepID=G8JW16_ERECY|nr:hypothetical protein Ecym_7183 [Eremothecium cymbalariae DBVPG\